MTGQEAVSPRGPVLRVRRAGTRGARAPHTRARRCRLLDPLQNRCPNEEVDEDSGLCWHHLALAAESYRIITGGLAA